jgi:hypothetical protein
MRLELDAARKEISFVAAVLVGPNGGRKIVEIRKMDSEARKEIKEFIKRAKPILRKKEKIFMVQYFGVSSAQLEVASKSVRLVD